MAYATSDIITWAKICQPLAAVGEAKKKALGYDNVDEDLHIKLYDARKSLEWELDQDSDSEYLFSLGNYVLALCGAYLMQAQQVSVSGGLVVIATTPTSGTAISMPWYFVYKSDFTDATDVTNASWDNQTVSVFYNGVRYLETNEYILLSGGLLRILVPGFNSADFESGKIIFRVDVQGEAEASDEVISSEYDLNSDFEIPSFEDGHANLRRTVVITPNGFNYTWPSSYIFTENWPEQPDANAEDTKQIYLFQYISGVGDVCIGQSLNIPI